jgi:D-aspartate ligase
LGYYGAFELEIIRTRDKALLIDMNGRFYNQLALDIARGLRLPQIVYAAAVGHDDEVARLVAAVPARRDRGREYAFCNHFGLSELVGVQRLFGSMSADEAGGWKSWYLAHKERLVDAVADRNDRAPWVAEIVSHVYGRARHPRSFLRTIALAR